MSAMSGGQAGYYLGLAREDYYLQGGEPPGRWFGSGAARLGLSGEIEPDHLYNLFDGRSPSGAVSLIQIQNHKGKADHRPGWDLTFSAPKSVSALWSQADESSRVTIQNVHAQAVEAALGYLQDVATSTRRGKGGGESEPVGMIAATFEHSTSRALDPQLHTHALVMNLSVRDDGTTGTLSSLDLFRSKMAAGALYRAELARGLQSQLGLTLRRERTWFEVTGVSPELVTEFSKRREAIKDELHKSGRTSAEASAVAALRTRSAKEGAARSELFEHWRRDGERLGWSTPEAQRLFRRAPDTRDFPGELRETLARATDRLTFDEAHFTRRDLVRYTAEEAQGRGLGATDVRNGVDEFLARSREIVRLGEHRGEERFTTRTMLTLERELLFGAQALRENDLHRLHSQTLVSLGTRHGTLSEEQLGAVWHVTFHTGALAVVSGMAGTGKTRMLAAAREAWEAEGFRVEGAALAARAAGELTEGSGIASKTIARTLMELETGKRKLTAKTVLVVDEAGMVATPDMRRLVLACQAGGAKLVLVGDERQLQPIGPGAPFRELGERFERAELRDIRRQSQKWAREAVKDMAAGRAREALSAFAERGLVRICASRDEAMRSLVAQWREDGAAPQDTLILAGTRTEVSMLNRLAQAARRAAGELGEAAALLDGERVYVGDRVMFTKNRPALGVDNGTRGIVSSISGDGERVSVRLDDGERVSFEAHALPDITLGYAATTHKAQGATTSRAYVLGGGPMQARELSYVQASRARLETSFFATEAEVGDDVAALAREMERSRQKEMAHTVLRNREAPTPDVAPVRPVQPAVEPKRTESVERSEAETGQSQDRSHERRRRG